MIAAQSRRNRRAAARSRRRAGRKTTQIGAWATTTWGYDSSDRLQYLRSGSLTRFTYSYDNNSNLKTVEDLIGSRSTYLYDAKNRLTQDATSGTNAHTYDYSYDSRDNRTYSGEEGQWQFAYDAANRLVTAVNAGEDPEPVRTFTYDDNGNMTRIEDSIAGTTTMAYDCENRLSVLHTASSLSTYLYDGDGRKRVEIGASGRTTLVWDGWDYLQSYSGSKPLDYHTVEGLILAQRFDEDYAEYLPDFLGTVAAYADESGSALAEARYKPYGLPLWSDGPAEDYAFGWVGQWGYRNAVSSYLAFIRQRHFTVPSGNWLTIDRLWPIERAYAYATGNPTSHLDPTGDTIQAQNCTCYKCRNGRPVPDYAGRSALPTAIKEACQAISDSFQGGRWQKIRKCLVDCGLTGSGADLLRKCLRSKCDGPGTTATFACGGFRCFLPRSEAWCGYQEPIGFNRCNLHLCVYKQWERCPGACERYRGWSMCEKPVCAIDLKVTVIHELSHCCGTDDDDTNNTGIGQGDCVGLCFLF